MRQIGNKDASAQFCGRVVNGVDRLDDAVHQLVRCEHRRSSARTIVAYRDTLRLLLSILQSRTGHAPTILTTAGKVVGKGLPHAYFGHRDAPQRVLD